MTDPPIDGDDKDGENMVIIKNERKHKIPIDIVG